MVYLQGTNAPKRPLSAARPRRLSEMRRRIMLALIGAGVLVVVGFASAIWLGMKATTVKDELAAATSLIGPLKEQIADDEAEAAASTVAEVRAHTSKAKEAVDDPLWTLSSSLPWIGANFSAVAEVARSADDVANLGLSPLVSAYESLDWNALLPSATGSDLDPLAAASPKVASAAHAVQESAERLDRIDEQMLLPEVAQPVIQARNELHEVTGALRAAADASIIAPRMLGSDSPRTYLLMIQNNAESRASGGIPGALALITLDQGKLSLGTQSTASDIGVMDPVIPTDVEQRQIYSGRLGKFMQDVNLTPDFATAASTARAMWERKTGQVVDGVISLDPVVLSYILNATGPVAIDGRDGSAIAGFGLPATLDGDNVVQTLLSDVYAKIQEPSVQDAYFAAVAQEIFAALSDGKGDAKGLIEGLTRGTAEGRVLVWSGEPSEQSILSGYPLSGSVTGPSISPAQFGVYFNDGTGAKMDYYVKRTVQMIRGCPRDGYEQTTVRITSTNNAPLDAATTLPSYVTGNGAFGVPAGSVQTNIVAYGPNQALVESARVDGNRTDFAPYSHSNRPVGVIAVRLAPGESKTVEFTFAKIVQHSEPNIVVTPTVQAVKDVKLPTENLQCG